MEFDDLLTSALSMSLNAPPGPPTAQLSRLHHAQPCILCMPAAGRAPAVCDAQYNTPWVGRQGAPTSRRGHHHARVLPNTQHAGHLRSTIHDALSAQPFPLEQLDAWAQATNAPAHSEQAKHAAAELLWASYFNLSFLAHVSMAAVAARRCLALF